MTHAGRPNGRLCCDPAIEGERHPVEHQQEECQMAYLDLSPAIAALRARPEEFEFSNGTLYHLGSRHAFLVVYFVLDAGTRSNSMPRARPMSTAKPGALPAVLGEK